VPLKHKGSLTFETRMGEGSSFHVRIPIDHPTCTETDVPSGRT
jgi:signal transduction histidine kinase